MYHFVFYFKIQKEKSMSISKYYSDVIRPTIVETVKESARTGLTSGVVFGIGVLSKRMTRLDAIYCTKICMAWAVSERFLIVFSALNGPKSYRERIACTACSVHNITALFVLRHLGIISERGTIIAGLWAAFTTARAFDGWFLKKMQTKHSVNKERNLTSDRREEIT